MLSNIPHVLGLSLGSSMVPQRAVFHCFPWLIFHCVHDRFFILSSVDGYLGCFHVLAIVNKVAVQLLQPLSSGFWSSQVRGPAVGLLHRMVAQLLRLNAALFCSRYWLLSLYISPAARGYTVLKKHFSIYYLQTFC